jgi:hypothetical protein
MFTVTGLIDKRRFHVSIDGETISGDMIAMAQVLVLIATKEQVKGTPTSASREASLKEPYTALLTVVNAFDEVEGITGDIPISPEYSAPEGSEF